MLLTPTLAEPPPVLGELVPSPRDPWQAAVRSGAFGLYTSPFNVTGQPAMSVPLFWTDGGLPIGIQLVAAYGRGDLLLRVASQLEAARPWADRHPAAFV